MQTILKLIRKKEKPLEQIVMRMEEIEKYNSDLKIVVLRICVSNFSK